MKTRRSVLASVRPMPTRMDGSLAVTFIRITNCRRSTLRQQWQRKTVKRPRPTSPSRVVARGCSCPTRTRATAANADAQSLADTRSEGRPGPVAAASGSERGPAPLSAFLVSA